MEEVPRRTSLVPLALPCFVLCLIGVETEGLLGYQGRAGIISIARCNLRLVMFGVETRVARHVQRHRGSPHTCATMVSSALRIPPASDLSAPSVMISLRLQWWSCQRKTKGQQLKGKIVRHFFTLFGTFWHFFTLFRTFSSRIFS